MVHKLWDFWTFQEFSSHLCRHREQIAENGDGDDDGDGGGRYK